MDDISMLGPGDTIPLKRITVCSDGSASGDGKRLGAAWAIAVHGKVDVSYIAVARTEETLANSNSSYAEYIAAIMAIESIEPSDRQKISFFYDSVEVFQSLCVPEDKKSGNPYLQTLHNTLLEAVGRHKDFQSFKCGNSGIDTHLLLPCHVFAKSAATQALPVYIKPDNQRIQRLEAPNFEQLCNLMRKPGNP